MTRGQLPDPNRRRRNAPTIPTTNLPAEGRQGDTPTCPYELGMPGKRWWDWAWHTPAAAGWDTDGDLYVVARRALMEDGDRTISILREAREIDDRLGLTPKGRAMLRWTIVATAEPAEGTPTEQDDEVARKRKERRTRLVG